MSDTAVQELLEKDGIRDQIYRYARGVDRMDRELTRSVWHADGTAQYFGFFEGSAADWIDWCWKAHEGMEAHSHQMTNVTIELDGDHATSETYAIVALRTVPDEAGLRRQIDVRGRYLDRWSKRDGRWAIDHRIHVVDLQSIGGEPISANAESRRDPEDVSYSLLRAAT